MTCEILYDILVDGKRVATERDTLGVSEWGYAKTFAYWCSEDVGEHYALFHGVDPARVRVLVASVLPAR